LKIRADCGSRIWLINKSTPLPPALHHSSRGSRRDPYNKQKPKAPPLSDWAPGRTSKRARANTPTSKKNKRRTVDRVDILQVMEPRDGRNVWDTSIVKDFMNDHQQARTILDYVVFQKDAALIFSGTINGKIPTLNITGHLTWPEWNAYKQDNIRIVTL
jgi:hypothetical protein